MALRLLLLLLNAVSVFTSRPHPTKTPYKPSYAPSYCDPNYTPTCAQNASAHESYCLYDPEYPEYEVKEAIEADPSFHGKYSDVAEQSADDLVHGVKRVQEESFQYDYYTGVSTGKSPFDLTHWAGEEGYACPAQVVYAMPKRARNVEGKWRVIINDGHYYSQTARLETCLYPEAACRALAPCYRSRCAQKYIYHRMLSMDPCDKYKGLFIDIYKFPSACSCHLPTEP